MLCDLCPGCRGRPALADASRRPTASTSGGPGADRRGSRPVELGSLAQTLVASAVDNYYVGRANRRRALHDDEARPGPGAPVNRRTVPERDRGEIDAMFVEYAGDPRHAPARRAGGGPHRAGPPPRRPVHVPRRAARRARAGRARRHHERGRPLRARTRRPVLDVRRARPWSASSSAISATAGGRCASRAACRSSTSRSADSSARLSQELGRSPTPSELAQRASVDEERVIEAMEAGGMYQLTSLDAPSSSGADTSAPDEFATLDQRMAIEELLATLPARERTIVELRFFDGLTQSEIAERVGISQMHVSRLLARSLTTLRERRRTGREGGRRRARPMDNGRTSSGAAHGDIGSPASHRPGLDRVPRRGPAGRRRHR